MPTAKLETMAGWSVFVPVKVVSEANTRCCWQVRHRRKKAQQAAVWAALLSDVGVDARNELAGRPTTITLTKIGGRTMDDDNLAGAFKGIRDVVADWIKLDDGDKRLTWVYAQRPKRRQPTAGVRIDAVVKCK